MFSILVAAVLAAGCENDADCKDKRARLVADVAAHGGFATAKADTRKAAVGLLGFSASAGAVFLGPGIGIVGIVTGLFNPREEGVLQLWTVGPAVRFGTTHHVTVGLMPTISSTPRSAANSTPLSGTTPLLGISGALVVQAAAVWGHFTLMAQPILQFDVSRFVFALTGALGVAF